MKEEILRVNNLITSFDTPKGRVQAVSGISFSLHKGSVLGIVGESGCGKTLTSLSIMRLLPKPAAKIDSGEILFKQKNILDLPVNEMYKIRGEKISMIFQEPMSALNPVHKIGAQIGETFRLHFPYLSEHEIYSKSLDLLKKVGIPSPERRMKEYPHQFSGGMRQRIVIAIALACEPEILIADEPTTALDVTIQAQILELMKALQKDFDMSIIFITHDLGVIAEICDYVIVMYAGRAVEKAEVNELFHNPLHPYTIGLLNSIPRLDLPPKHKLQTIEGMVPSLLEMPDGCRFQNRCPYVIDKCKNEEPEEEYSDSQKTHSTCCFRWKEIKE